MLKVMLRKSKSMQNNLDVSFYSTVLYKIICSCLLKQYSFHICFHKRLLNIIMIV